MHGARLCPPTLVNGPRKYRFWNRDIKQNIWYITLGSHVFCRMKLLVTYLHLLCLTLALTTVSGCDDVASPPTGIEKKDGGRAVDPPVAFTAGLSASSPCFNSGAATVTVPYDYVLLNHGEGYDLGTNHFVAPVRGLYRYEQPD